MATTLPALALGAFAALLTTTPGTASAEIPPGTQCRAAAAAAERRWSLPPHLLLAIGEVESGRPDPGGGPPQPWPWTADVGGQDYVFRSSAEAVAVVGFLRERGIGSIDVGCFQVNLHYHPAAFPRVADGFDPATNADYAARFLRGLFAHTADWAQAVAAYHSADPALGLPYRDRVLLTWRRLASGTALAGPPLQLADPYVILAAASAASIPVYTPQTLPAAWRARLGLPDGTAGRHW